MYKLTMFDTVEELLELTGDKDEDELWKAGFNLDDWDAGFQTNRPMHHMYVIPEEDRDAYDEPPYERAVINDDAWWLGCRMEDYCVGYSYTEYKGMHYYLVHHA